MNPTLCKQDKPITTIQTHLSNLRFFARYLKKKEVESFDKINRDLILDFIVEQHQITGKDGIIHRLGVLRKFFTSGNLHGWFVIKDQDLIRSSDFPRVRKGNPEPLSNKVREAIEKNLHKLPDPLARMWLIGFFTAMRPNEMVLLKKNCLVQEGQNWKIVWSRKRGRSQHEVPITRTIAKVIQEQIDYIEQLWGQDWNDLFCHYQGISESNIEHPRLKPVRKKASVDWNPLKRAVQTLINNLNIKDENGNLAKFSLGLIRPTRLTQLFEQGHDLAVVSAWAGHKRLATTSTFYTHVSCHQIEAETNQN